MGFKAASDEAEKEYAEEKAEEMQQGGDQEPIVRLTKGPNVIWVLPRKDSMPSAIMRKLVHYAPFHSCGREDPVPDFNGDSDDDYIRDKFFSNCFRCQEAWNVYEEQGKPGSKDNPVPKYSKFLDEMSDEQDAFNAVDLTTFFDQDSKGYAVPNEDRIERWGETFVEVMKGEKEPPEDMPDEMAEHAVASPSPVLVSTSKVGKPLRDKISDKRYRSDDEDPDPLLDPESQLIEIKKEYTGETFESRGQEQSKCEYTIRFTPEPNMEDFVMPDGLMEAAEELSVDLADPSYEADGEDEEENLTKKMRALVKPTDEEIEDYLNIVDHSFYVGSGDSGEGEGADDEKFSDDQNDMTEEQESRVEDVKNKMHGDDEEEAAAE